MNDEIKEKEKVEEKPPEEESFTNIVERFAGLVKRFKIKNSEVVADHCAKGNLEDLEDIEVRMREMLVHPSLVRQVVNFWADEIHYPIPKRLRQKMERLAGVKKEGNAEDETERIYFVESDTAVIRLASGNERVTTLTEAKELQKLIKKDLEEARKRQEAEGGGKEPAFVMGEQGSWTFNPKAKIGLGEFAVFQMYQESLKRGEPIDPVEEMARREESSARLREAMGVKAGGEDTEMNMLDKLDKLGMLKKGEGGEGTLLSQLAALGLLKKSGEEGSATQIEMLDKLNQLGMLKKPGEEDAGSSTIRALETQIKELADSLRKQEMDTVRNAVVLLSNQLTEMRKEMSTQGKLEGRYALLEKTISTIDSQLTGIRTDAKPLLSSLAGGSGAEPARRSPEEKAKIAKGLKGAVAQEKEARELEDELLFGGKPPG